MFDKLYARVGKNIQLWAKLVFALGTGFSIIVGIIFIILGLVSLPYTEYDIVILAGVCWAVGGPMISWISSLFLYAFGQLVDDVHAIRDKEGTTEEVNAKLLAEERARQECEEKAPASAPLFFCSECNHIFAGKNFLPNDRPACPNCNRETFFAGIKKEEWIQMTKEYRQEKLQELINQHENS